MRRSRLTQHSNNRTANSAPHTHSDITHFTLTQRVAHAAGTPVAAAARAALTLCCCLSLAPSNVTPRPGWWGLSRGGNGAGRTPILARPECHQKRPVSVLFLVHVGMVHQSRPSVVM